MLTFVAVVDLPRCKSWASVKISLSLLSPSVESSLCDFSEALTSSVVISFVAQSQHTPRMPQAAHRQVSLGHPWFRCPQCTLILRDGQLFCVLRRLSMRNFDVCQLFRHNRRVQAIQGCTFTLISTNLEAQRCIVKRRRVFRRDAVKLTLTRRHTTTRHCAEAAAHQACKHTLRKGVRIVEKTCAARETINKRRPTKCCAGREQHLWQASVTKKRPCPTTCWPPNQWKISGTSRGETPSSQFPSDLLGCPFSAMRHTVMSSTRALCTTAMWPSDVLNGAALGFEEAWLRSHGGGRIVDVRLSPVLL